MYWVVDGWELWWSCHLWISIVAIVGMIVA